MRLNYEPYAKIFQHFIHERDDCLATSTFPLIRSSGRAIHGVNLLRFASRFLRFPGRGFG